MRGHRGEGADGGDEGDSGAANDILADKSPSSDLCMEYDDTIPEEAETEDKSDGNNNINDVADIEEHIDQDSLDEGLGDISSDGEVAESPELKDPCPDKFPSDNNNTEEAAQSAQVTDNICPT